MPYGVSAQLWKMLPAEDQLAVQAGYEASQGSQPAVPPPPPPPPAVPTPPTTNVGSSSAASSRDSAGNVIYYTDGAWYYANGSPATGPGEPPPAGVSTPAPAAPPSSPPAASPPAGGDLGDLAPTDVGDVTFELFSVEAPDAHAPGGPGGRLPSTAWGDFRDYFARDQPFLGSHIRNQGKQLKGVVASDLWSPST